MNVLCVPHSLDPCRSYLTESVYKVVLQSSIPAQIRQLVLCFYLNKEQVDGFVREIAFAKRLHQHSLCDNIRSVHTDRQCSRRTSSPGCIIICHNVLIN